MEIIDAAYNTFREIRKEVGQYLPTVSSETDTRFKVIDRILTEVLGYDFSDITTEPYSGTGYIDYQISIKGVGRIVIEAKKDAQNFEIDKSYSGRAYNLDGPVFKNKDVKEGLSQTVYYCAQESIELGCLTNGNTWIIFRANRMGDGYKVWNGKGIIFGSLESIEKDFKLFFELLSPSNVENFTYRAIFQELEGQEIRTNDFAQALKTESTIRLFETNYSSDFERVMSTFFSKLTGDDDPEFLVNCFVETKESQAAEFQLARISEELISKIRTIETIEANAIRAVIERIKLTNRQEFIILVGAKGAGKSTFVDRFFNYVLSSSLKEDCVIVKLNLAGYKGSEIEIIKWLDETLLDQCEITLYDGAPSNEQIQGIFYGEYRRLRQGPWKILYEKNKDQFKIDFGKHIEHRRETRPTEYIQKLIGNIVKSRRKIPCLVFDNTDHFSIEIQEKVFQYARSIYENEICLVILPITDKTSWELSKQGAIRSYESEVLFLPTPSPKKVIEKRIQYLDKKIEFEKKYKGQYFLKKGIQIELQDIEGFVRYLQLLFLHDQKVSKWVGSLSNYDIRTSLEITKDIIASPHLTIDEFLRTYVARGKQDENEQFTIKPFRIKNALIKRKYQSYPINHHPFVQNLYYSTGNINTTPLLCSRILQVLTDRKTDRSADDSFLPTKQVFDYFNAMGIDRSVTHKHLQFLLQKGLISAFDPTVTDIDFAKSIEISPSGTEHYYWSINDIDYTFIMLEVTPITNKMFFNEINGKYYSAKSKLDLTSKFLDYLEIEDAKYCKIPDHISYAGQKMLHTRFDWQRKIINRYINRSNGK